MMEGLKGIMKRPGDQDVPKHSSNGVTESDIKRDRAPSCCQIPSLTRQEHPAHRNLLTNSLSARLRKVFPKVAERRNGGRPFRGTSADNLFHLTQSGDRRVGNDVYESIRRQQRVKRNLEWSRKKQARLQERLMSWASDTERYLPGANKDGGERELSESSSVTKDKIRFDDFPREHGCSVMSYSSYTGGDSVRVFKKDGVFRPVNKYGKSRVRKGADDIPFSNTLVDYETVTIELKGPSKEHRDSDASRTKKGLSVSFSAQYGRSDSLEETKSEKDSKASSVRSFSSEQISWRKPEFSKSRSKVEKIGVRWNVPAPSCQTFRRQPSPPPAERGGDKPSRDLTPVTRGMNKQGTSAEKTRWHVQQHGTGGGGGNNVYNIQGSLRTLRQMTFRASKANPPRRVSFTDNLDSLICPSC